MVAPFAVAVAVAGVGHHLKFVVGELRPGGHRQGAAMDAVEGVAPEIMGKLPRLADAGDHEEAFRLDLQLRQGLLAGLEDAEVAAARAPGRLDALI